MRPEGRTRGIGDAPRSTPIGRSRRLILAVPPVLITLAAFAGGATSTALAPVLTTTLALVLAASLALDRHVRLTGVAGPAILFGALLVYGIWTLTPLTIGEAPPIWALIDATPSTTIDRSATVRELVKLSGLACIFLIGVLHGQRRGEARFAADAVIATGVALLTVCMLLHALGFEQTGFGTRMVGPMGSPNVIGTAAGVYLVLALARLAQRLEGRPIHGWRDIARQLQNGAPFVAAILLCAAALVLSASRGAAAATLTMVAVWAGWRLVRGRSPARLALGIGLILVAVTAFVFLMTPRLDTLDLAVDVGSSERLSGFSIYWQTLYASPLFGYGLGTFDAVNRQILTSETYTALWQNGAAHNVFLQWLMEAGAVGSALMFATIGWVLLRGWGRVRWAGPALAAGVFLLHGLTDFTLQVFAMAALFAYLLGLHAAPRASRS
ncbi:hypothetical protein MMB232_01155 [Brevundimonas subvibrioides]|uniref:O-antigen ligase family protein n=1 Tax=Brevundimonas subvibrioides TaxID=74313 RepID=UPI0032D58CE4